MPDDDIEEIKFEKREGLEKESHDIDKIARDVRETQFYHPKKASFADKAKSKIKDLKEKYNHFNVEQRAKKKASLEAKIEKAKEKREMASLENEAITAEASAKALEAKNRAARPNPFAAIRGVFGGRKTGKSRFEEKYSGSSGGLLAGGTSSKSGLNLAASGGRSNAGRGQGTMGKLLMGSGKSKGLSVLSGGGKSGLSIGGSSGKKGKLALGGLGL